jgi:hypothetical protein
MGSDGKIKSLFRSRRFWAGLTGVVLAFVGKQFGIPEETILSVTGLIAAWIVGDSLTKTS